MAKTAFGNPQTFPASPSQVAYTSGKSLLVGGTTGYVAVDGDRIDQVYWGRSNATTGKLGLELDLYVSPTGDRATATYLKTLTWDAPVSPVYTLTLSKVFPEPETLVAGYHYWLNFRRTATNYSAKASASTTTAEFTTLALAAAAPATLGDMAGVTSANVNGPMIGVLIANRYAKTIVTLGTAAPSAQHIAKDLPAFQASGTYVEVDDFTASGAEVLLRTDGTFEVDAEGAQQFTARFSADAGATWSAEQTIAINDLTA